MLSMLININALRGLRISVSYESTRPYVIWPRLAHNPEVGGSNPPPASSKVTQGQALRPVPLFCALNDCSENVAESETDPLIRPH